MNFLAHFHLAKATDASRVGAILGDFVRGTPESLTERFPDEVVEGIMLHRAVDHFTDTHPVFLKAKELLAPSRRRFAGIVIDVLFDHFLAHYWKEFSDEGLDHFISEIYLLLERRDEWLTPELRALVPRMKSENWLSNYGTIEDLSQTFKRISQRRDFLSPLVNAEEDLVTHYQSFSRAFHQFYPDIQKFTTQWPES